MNFKGKKMTEREYREHSSLCRSDLWWMNETPQKFKYHMTNSEPPTESLLFGSTLHKLVLEPNDFDNEYVLEPNVDRRTKDGKEQYANWLATVGDKTIISEKIYNKAVEMRDALLENKLATALLQGEKECAYFWTDDMTNVDCKCRLDCLRELNGKLLIVDLKTSTSSNPDKWVKDSLKYGYHMQAAMYSQAIIANYGVKPDFVFICIEKDPPFAINIFKVCEDYYNYGLDTYRYLIGLYKHCVDTNEWYGYLGESNQINDLTLPSWLGGGEE